MSRLSDPAGPTLAEVIAGYLVTLDHHETAGTRRVYAGTLVDEPLPENSLILDHRHAPASVAVLSA